MIMVQKPVHLLSSPTSFHRRLPSAPPAVLVQPTRTPGLLSLSKPAPVRPQPRQQHPRQSRAARPKDSSPPAPLPPADPAKDKKFSASKDATVATIKDVSVTPKAKAPNPQALHDKDVNSRSPRGRQRARAGKDKTNTRGTSHSSVHTGARRRQPHHQGSPPQPSHIPSQAEAKENLNRSQSPQARNHNQFDPFLGNSSDSDSDIPRSTSLLAQKKGAAQKISNEQPKLATRPSGKLARRRQALPEAPASPTPSRAVPVPSKARARDTTGPQLSRSAPTQAGIRSRSRPTPSVSDMFPICDDMTDVDEDEQLPITPTRARGVTWQQQGLVDDGPRTAPLSSAFTSASFFAARSTTPTPTRRRANHIRSPSEGVFNLSFEEDSSSSSSSSGAEELKALVGLLPRRRVPSSPMSTPPSNKHGRRPPGFFASSTFQNSPSPDDLPAPLF